MAGAVAMFLLMPLGLVSGDHDVCVRFEAFLMTPYDLEDLVTGGYVSVVIDVGESISTIVANPRPK